MPDGFGVIFRIHDFQIPDAGFLGAVEADQLFIAIFQFIVAQHIFFPALGLAWRYIDFLDVIPRPVDQCEVLPRPAGSYATVLLAEVMKTNIAEDDATPDDDGEGEQ